MAKTEHRKAISRRETHRFRRVFCCRFGIPPKSPEYIAPSDQKSPQINRSALGRVGFMDPRRILSPGRVSPIDNETPPYLDPEMVPELSSCKKVEHEDSKGAAAVSEAKEEIKVEEDEDEDEDVGFGVYDVRLSLKGKNGGRLVLELDSKVLSANSSVFANLISESRSQSGASVNFCRIEVPEVENLVVFHETIELMFEVDIAGPLVKMGVSRSIDVLEVSAGIMFTKGVLACLKYLEAVPWNEAEEDKLKSLFTRFTFDDATTRDVLARLYPQEEIDSQEHLVMQLVRSVTNGADDNSRNELKSLVMSLLSRSSIYEKNLTGLNKQDFYAVSLSCVDSLVEIFEEASDSLPKEKSAKVETTKPLLERISMQVDNINWLLEILLEQQVAEEFVDVWANQSDLLRMHESLSPMIRYELSRVSAWLFVALGTGKLHCRMETRSGVLAAWLIPMLVDFGWLKRCRKGLDIKALEEAMGQALLTLPMRHQQFLFMEWFHSFSRHGTECPNLSKAFQIWWRRSSLKSYEARTLDSR